MDFNRYRFRGARYWMALMDLAVCAADSGGGSDAGLALFSVNGFYGRFLAQFDIKVTYARLGIAVAMAFTSIPFVVRTVSRYWKSWGRNMKKRHKRWGHPPAIFAKSCCLGCCRLR